jgi:rSAM/selenodomain-associated transferase 2
MKISIIIPTLNESQTIGSLIEYLKQNSQPDTIAEILIVDGGSQDATSDIAEVAGARVISSAKGRAVQMNTGAKVASGEMLYFLHADTYPPLDFDQCILKAYREGYQAGSFCHSFDDDHPILRLTSWIVNHESRVQFGDQSFYVLKSVFETIHGFDEHLIIMEDADFTIRLRRDFRFQRVDCAVTTSARKFRENGELRLLLIFFLIYSLYELKFPQTILLRLYRGLIRQKKI